MDMTTLHKKLSTYVSEKGRLSNVGEEVLFEVLNAWEEWQGTAKAFYKAIGFSYKQMASIIGKAKKLKRQGHFGDANFKELQIQSESQSPLSNFTGQFIELVWDNNKVLRFPQVDMLLEFLKRTSQ